MANRLLLLLEHILVGFGKIGQALAHAFARNNIDVTVASRRRPEELVPQAQAIGPTAVAKSLQESLKADTIFLAVQFDQHPDVAKALPSWKGKTVIDVTNSFGVPPEELDGLPSSVFVAKSFPGAKVVKGFNHLIAATLATDPVVEGGHRVVFLSSDDEDAVGPVADLAEQLRFAPVKLGKLNEGGWLVHARGRTWGQLMTATLPSSFPILAPSCVPRNIQYTGVDSSHSGRELLRSPKLLSIRPAREA